MCSRAHSPGPHGLRVYQIADPNFSPNNPLRLLNLHSNRNSQLTLVCLLSKVVCLRQIIPALSRPHNRSITNHTQCIGYFLPPMDNWTIASRLSRLRRIASDFTLGCAKCPPPSRMSPQTLCTLGRHCSAHWCLLW